MIAFRDFSHSAYGRPEGLDQALVQANEWLIRSGIAPLNIETLRTYQGGGLARIQSHDIGVRVWYRIGSAPTAVA